MSDLITDIPVVRLSVYDAIEYKGGIHTIGDLLEGKIVLDENIAYSIQNLINKRI